jgi:hypothetical protein
MRVNIASGMRAALMLLLEHATELAAIATRAA